MDYLLEIQSDDEELVQSRLFLTASTGSTSGNGTTIAYFDTKEDRDDAARSFTDLQTRSYEAERENWLEKYQQSLEPLHIGKRFIIVPDPELVPHVLIVPQEQAFGTGSHETTSLCIELLESLDLRGKRGLDIGSGSGILGLAMHRLGATKIIAFDNDTDAYGALRDNRMRNDVPDSAMPLFIGSIEALRAGTFDVVTMNIIPEVIIPLLGDVVPRVGGHLILSGILIVRRDDVVAAARAHGLTVIDERTRGEWWAALLDFNRDAEASLG